MRGLALFLPLLLRLHWRLLVALLLSLVALFAGIGLFGVAGWFITAAGLSTAGALFNIMAPSAGVRGFSFLRILARYGERLTGHGATLSLVAQTRAFVFGRLFQRVPFNAQIARGDLVSRLVADLDMLDTIVLLALGPISTAAIVGIVLAAALAWLLPGAVLAFSVTYLCAAVALPFALVALSRAPAGRAVAAASRLRAGLLEGIDGQLDLVVFGAIDRLRVTAGAACRDLAAARKQLGMLAALAAFGVQALAALALVATLWAGLEALDTGQIDGPLLVGIVLAVLASFEATAALVRSSSRLSASLAAADRIVDLVGTETSSVTAPTDLSAPATSAPATLRLQGLHFAYPGGRAILDGLDLDLPPGERLAIVGPSGCGKSTLAALLVRLIEPQSGEILLDGIAIAQMDVAALRRRVAVMTQDAPVFADTVRANLLMGRPDADEAALWEALSSVGLDEVVRGLPHGLDSLVGEAGRSLSVGQARRLALARILLCPAQLVVLDEPTSGLDTVAARAFMASLAQINSGRSVLVITHDTDLPGFDRVLDLRGGRLVPAA